LWFDFPRVTDFLSHRLIARLAGWMYIAGSFILAPLLIVGEGWDAGAVLSVGGAGVAIGIATLLLPWQRWKRSTTLLLVPPAFALIAVGNALQDGDPWLYGIYFVVVFAWIGVAHPPRTTLKFLPMAALAYVVPGFFVDLPDRAYSSMIVVMAVCILVGEGLAWVASRARVAERTDVQRMRSMEALLTATVQLARQTDPAQAADRVAELTCRLLGGEGAIVLLLDPAGGVRGAGAHRWPVPADEVHARWLDPPAREAMATGGITAHRGAALAGDLTHAAAGAPVVFLPLSTSTRPLGVVMVTFDDAAGTQLDAFTAGLVSTFTTQAGLAFERLRATEQLIEESLRDALTGIGNRRQAERDLASVGSGDAVAILDLDHFKRVNDRFGHATGDKVLFDLAHYLLRYLREGDSVARYGGEEFVVILKRVGDSAESVLERIAEDWRETGPRTTFSVGVAIHQAHETPADTLARADAALYQAKKAGRDRVVLAVTPSSGSAPSSRASRTSRPKQRDAEAG
jgi:diguanylate cyclase (GGDEF)-like protein